MPALMLGRERMPTDTARRIAMTVRFATAQ